MVSVVDWPVFLKITYQSIVNIEGLKQRGVGIENSVKKCSYKQYSLKTYVLWMSLFE